MNPTALRSPSIEVDRLIEAAWHSADVAEWGIDSLGGGAGIYSDEHIELDAIYNTISQLSDAVRWFVEYSDGRRVRTMIEIEHGYLFCKIWPAEPDWAASEKQLSEGRLAVDPGQQDRGGWRVYGDETRSAMRVEYLNAKPHLAAVQ